MSECHDSCCSKADSCGSSKSKCGCGCSCSSCSTCCGSQQGKFADELLKIADQAWMEVLKEKIKDEIRQLSNDHLSQMAKLVAEANHVRWKEKMKARKDIHDYEDQLRGLFCSHQCNKSGK